MFPNAPLRSLARIIHRSLHKHSRVWSKRLHSWEFRCTNPTLLTSTRTTSIQLPATHGDSIHVELGTTEGRTVKTSFHHFWLRDSCQCPQCYNIDTNQRLFDTSSLSTSIRPQEMSVVDRTSLVVKWEDGHCSTFSGNWLLKHSHGTVWELPQIERVAWGREIGETPPTLSYSELMAQDVGLLALYNNMEVYGFCLVRGTPLEPSATEALINRLGIVRHTFFGGFCVVEANLDKK